jgi:hypothetical protein
MALMFVAIEGPVDELVVLALQIGDLLLEATVFVVNGFGRHG